MKTSYASSDLQARIKELQQRTIEERNALKTEIKETVNNIEPGAILTKVIKEIISSPKIKDGLFGISLGMSAGYITKKNVVGKSESTILNIAGHALGMFVSKNIALNSGKIKTIGMALLENIYSSTKSKSEEE